MLGIIREGEGTAVRILEGLNVDLQKLRKALEGSIRPTADLQLEQATSPS